MNSLSNSLIKWFHRHRKSYPWRINRTPYSVWISEIMLQQTVVSTVVPYFEKWMRNFPTVGCLAASNEAKVLSFWEGLGYYSRARNIIRTARILVEKFHGQVPDSYDAIIRLPGIGPYTAAAILSMAYGQVYPLMDANIRRICQRLLAIREWDKNQEAVAVSFLKKNISSKAPGDFNEALMELGQNICTGAEPACENCPIMTACKSFKRNIQGEIPAVKKTEIIAKKTSVFLITRGDHVLMKRNTSGMFIGMWSFPMTPYPGNGTPLSRIKKSTGLEDIGINTKIGRFVHQYTKYRDTLIVNRIKTGKEARPRAPWVWIPFKRLARHAMPVIYRKIVRGLVLNR